MARIDLHTHSLASDGNLSPGALVRSAKKAKLAAVALTDHDTLAGLPEFLHEAERLGITPVPGVELAVDHPRHGSLDILGLWVHGVPPAQNGPLAKALLQVGQAREERNRIMAAKLADMGLDVTYEDVRQLAGVGRGGQSVGRPHFAQLLVAKGYVKTVKQAFERFLRDGGPAYASKRTLSPERAVRLLLDEGAVTLLAHPLSYPRLKADDLEPLLLELRGYGLDGLEAYYPEYGPEDSRRLMALAERLGLAVSGGSDFHGGVKPDIRLGTGKGRGFGVPALVLEKLRNLRGNS